MPKLLSDSKFFVVEIMAKKYISPNSKIIIHTLNDDIDMLMSRCYPTNCIYDFQVKTHITFFYYFTSHESVYMYIMLSCTITLKATENTLHPPWHKKRVHNFAMAFHFTQGKNDAKRKYGSERWTILSALFRLRSIFFFVLNISNLKTGNVQTLD